MGEEDEHEIDASKASRSTWAAVRMIFFADFVMSLDNMLAVAGAAGEKWWMVIMGLLVSIVIIMFFSAVIANLMNRYHWIVYLGAAILAFTAGEMMMGDRELASYMVRTHRVSLNAKWEDDFMVTRGRLSTFHVGDGLPEGLSAAVRFREIEFVGQMTEKQRDELLLRVDSHADRETIEEMYARSHLREVPAWAAAATEWIPGGSWLAPRLQNWVQTRWTADAWHGIQGRQYHFVAWIFYGVVVVFCLGLPRALRRRKKRAEGAAGLAVGTTT